MHNLKKSALRVIGNPKFAPRKVEVSSEESPTLLGGKSESPISY